jgi:hypothetical protein
MSKTNPAVKPRLSHPTPAWWREKTNAERVAMGKRVHEKLQPMHIDYGVNDGLIRQLNAVNTALSQLDGYRDNVSKLGEYYTTLWERLINGEIDAKIVIDKIIAAALGPSPETIVNGALLGILIAIENVLVTNAKYNLDPSVGQLLGYIALPKPPVGLDDLIKLSANARAHFTGGYIVLTGHLPKPAKYWRIYCDCGDGQGRQVLDKLAAAEYTDEHELPERPTTWTYEVELQNKANQVIGKINVIALSVWKGMAQLGPEGQGE